MDLLLFKRVWEQFILPGLVETGEKLIERSLKFWEDFWDAFPHPVRMVDVTIRFLSGLAGFIVQIPIAGTERRVVAALRQSKAIHQVVTTEAMVRIWFDMWRTAIQLVTFTGETSLLTFIATLFAKWIWRTFKHLRLIGPLIKARTEAELIEVFIQSLTRRATLYRIVGMVVGVAVIVVVISFVIWTVAMSVTTLQGKIWDKPLPQDSKIVKVKVDAVVRRRVNLRKGKDQ